MAEDIFHRDASVLTHGPTSVAALDGVRRAAHGTLDNGLGIRGSCPVQVPEEKQQSQAEDDAKVEQGHEVVPPRRLGVCLHGDQERLRVPGVGGVPDLRQLSELVPWRALPVAAVAVLEGVDLRVCVVADPRHAIGQAFVVGVVA